MNIAVRYVIHAVLFRSTVFVAMRRQSAAIDSVAIPTLMTGGNCATVLVTTRKRANFSNMATTVGACESSITISTNPILNIETALRTELADIATTVAIPPIAAAPNVAMSNDAT